MICNKDPITKYTNENNIYIRKICKRFIQLIVFMNIKSYFN